MQFPIHSSIAEVGIDQNHLEANPHLVPGTMLINNRGLWSWTVDPSPEQLFTLSPGTIMYSAGVYEDPQNGGAVLSAFMIDYAEQVSDGALHFNFDKIGMGIQNSDGSAYSGPLLGEVIAAAAHNGNIQAMSFEGKVWENMRPNPSDIVSFDGDISVEGKPEDLEVADVEAVAWAVDAVSARWENLTGNKADVALRSVPSIGYALAAEFQEKGWKPSLNNTHYAFLIRDSRLPRQNHRQITVFIKDLMPDTIDAALEKHLNRMKPSEEMVKQAQAILAAADI